MAVTLSMTETHIEMMEEDYSSGEESSAGASDTCSRSPLTHSAVDGARRHVYVTNHPEEQHGSQLESLQQESEDPLNVVDDHAIDRGSANNEDLMNDVMDGGSSPAATQGTAGGQGEDGKAKVDGQGTPTWSYREQFKQVRSIKVAAGSSFSLHVHVYANVHGCYNHCTCFRCAYILPCAVGWYN